MVEQLQQEKHRVRHKIFSLVLLFVLSHETWNVMAWDGLVQPTGKYCSMSHGIPEISSQNFWSNGKRPRTTIPADKILGTLAVLIPIYNETFIMKHPIYNETCRYLVLPPFPFSPVLCSVKKQCLHCCLFSNMVTGTGASLFQIFRLSI